MIQTFVDRFMAAEKPIFKNRPTSYLEIFTRVIELISMDDCKGPDVNRIHCIDDGNYQGTLLFVVAEKGYQPSRYWATKVYYGSCSGFDTLQALYRQPWESDGILNRETQQMYWTEALHMVQNLKEI